MLLFSQNYSYGFHFFPFDSWDRFENCWNFSIWRKLQAEVHKLSFFADISTSIPIHLFKEYKKKSNQKSPEYRKKNGEKMHWK